MRAGTARGVALGVALAMVAAGSGCQSIPPAAPREAPAASRPSSAEEARRVYEQCALVATKAGFLQGGREFNIADVAPLFEAAGSEARNAYNRGLETRKKARGRIAAGSLLLTGGVGIGFWGPALAGTMAMGAAMSGEDEDTSDIEALISVSITLSVLAVLVGSGFLISARAPSRDAAASFRHAANAYNADLRRRLGLVGPAQ